MPQTICVVVVCLENVLVIHAFSGPQPPVRASDLTRNVYIGTTLRRQYYYAIGPIFRIFMHDGSAKKTAMSQLCT